LFAEKKARLALGPFLDIRLNQAGLAFPNSSADCWDEGADGGLNGDCAEGDATHRKVYSTVQASFLVRAGIQLRFGVARK
jgi:hypothetical protein